MLAEQNTIELKRGLNVFGRRHRQILPIARSKADRLGGSLATVQALLYR